MINEHFNFLLRHEFFQRHALIFLILFCAFLTIAGVVIVFMMVSGLITSVQIHSKPYYSTREIVQECAKQVFLSSINIPLLVTLSLAIFVPDKTHSEITETTIYPNNENFKIVFPTIDERKEDLEISDLTYSIFLSDYKQVSKSSEPTFDVVFVKGDHTHLKKIIILPEDVDNLSASSESKVVKATISTETYDTYTLLNRPTQVTKRYMKLTFGDEQTKNTDAHVENR